jgi:hypothetical protein
MLAPGALQAQVPLTGQVVAMPGGTPLAGVEVRIRSLTRSVRTDSNGVFLMDSVPSGRYLVEALKLGYRPFSNLLSVQSASDPEYRIELSAAPTTVATVVTTADALNTRMAGFEERRLKRGSAGYFLTAKDFAEHVGHPTADILARVPGIDITRGKSGAAFIGNNRGVDTMRENLLPRVTEEDRQRGGRRGTCYAAVMLNGVIMYDGASQSLFDVNSIPAQEILGMEYYAGAASIPLQWSALTQACGLLAIWTR